MTDEPNSYRYWVKAVAWESLVGYPRDWEGVGYLLWEVACAIAESAGKSLMRVLVLLTMPISAPVLAWYCMQYERMAIEKRKQRKDDIEAALFSLAQKEQA